jgi:FAD/FMN-containing dehydrogenase
LSTDDLRALTDRLPDRVFGPGTDAYDQATTPRNATARQQPAAVVAARSADDVAAAVRAAGATGLRVLLQATGHGAAGEVGDDTVLLDTSGLDSVEVDPDHRVVRAGAGATFGAINAAAFEHGLLALAGTAPDVAVVGYTVLGGVGWLTRPYGMASASLLSVDLVDGTGEQLHADDQQHADLLWAYRGGGGVGVATAVELRLFPADNLHAGYLLWDAEHAATVIPVWGDALNRLHPALSSAVGLLLHAPDAPTVPESLRGKPVVHLAAATVAGATAMQTLRDVLAGLPEPAIDTLGPCDAQRLSGIHLDPPAPVPAHGEGRWLTGQAGSHALQILTAAGTSLDSPLAEVELRHVAAPASDVPGAETSCPGAVLLHATGPAPDPDARAKVEAALEKVLAAARPVDTGRSATSFRDGQDAAYDARPTEFLTRLDAIRHLVDPAGVIVASKLLR